MVQTVDGVCIEWAMARTAARGHADSGDHFCVRQIEHRTLVAVLDGLGHGPAAADVARLGVRLLEQTQTHDIVRLVRDCHAGLRGSRGLVMSLALFDEIEKTVTWIGVGNVGGTLWSPGSSLRRTLLLRGGLVGNALPQLQASVVPLSEGDMLVFTTDGVGSDIDSRLLRGSSVQAIAERILTQCSNGRDDALALVARYRGATG